MSFLGNRRGDTLVEVVLAMAILSLTLTSAYSVANTSYHAGVQARENAVAAELIQDQSEKLQAYRNQLVAADSTGLAPVLTAANFNNASLIYMTGAGPVTTTAAATTPASVCFSLPGSCHVQIAISPSGLGFPLDAITATITVSWTSLLGGGTNLLTENYYLTDSRSDTNAVCNNSLAGTCE